MDFEKWVRFNKNTSNANMNNTVIFEDYIYFLNIHFMCFRCQCLNNTQGSLNCFVIIFNTMATE